MTAVRVEGAFHRRDGMRCPDFNRECVVCLQELFDSNGCAQNGPVAKLRCIHIVHSHCLRESARALNSDGKRYGIGGFGPRQGCPLCSVATSLFFEHIHAYEFPCYWIPKVQKCLDELGGVDEDLKLSRLVKLLIQEDPKIKKILENKAALKGLKLACEEGRKFLIEEIHNGGPSNPDGGCLQMYISDGYWKHDITDDVDTERMRDNRYLVTQIIERVLRACTEKLHSFWLWYRDNRYLVTQIIERVLRACTEKLHSFWLWLWYQEDLRLAWAIVVGGCLCNLYAVLLKMEHDAKGASVGTMQAKIDPDAGCNDMTDSPMQDLINRYRVNNE